MASKEKIESVLSILEECNFSSEQCKRVLTKISYFIKGNCNLRNKIDEYKKILMEYGYDEAGAIDRIISNPRPLWNSYEKNKKDIEVIVAGGNKKNIKIVDSAIKNVNVDGYKNDDVFDYLIDFGFSTKIINKDRKLGSILAYTDLESLKRLINFYFSFGYSKEDIIKCGNRTLLFLVNSDEFFVYWFRFFKKYNISNEEFMIMYKRNTHGFSYDGQQVDNVISWFRKFGFDQKQINKTIIGQPSLLNAVEDLYTEKLDNLLGMGYTREQVIKLVSLCPSILSNSILSTNYKFNILLDYGYTFEEATKITMGYPDYYSIGIPNIIDKLDAIADACLLDEIINCPKNLIQSAQLTRERCWYMLGVLQMTRGDEYRKRMFCAQENFFRKFKISSKDLSELYEKRRRKILSIEMS